jgi:HJR/Mrr/RecB family endonuclease
MPRRQSRRRSRPAISHPVLIVACVVAALAVAGGLVSSGRSELIAVALIALVAGKLLWRRFRRRTFAAHALDDLLALSPAQFEDAVAALLRRHGYRDVRRIGGAGDLGADLIGRDPRGRVVVVQCKRYAPSHRVGSPLVQPLYSTKALYRAERALFVSTSSFSRPAVEVARRLDIDLIDGPALSRMLAA